MEEVEDEGVGTAVTDGGVGFGGGGGGDAGAELGGGGFELIFTGRWGRALVALLETDVSRFGGVEAGAYDCLRVVHVEDVDVFGDCGLAATLRGG